VQPAAGALLDLRLVELATECRHLGTASGVGVGVAGGDGPAVGTDADQRGGEGVECDTADAAPQSCGGQAGDDLLELVDHLVRVDLARAVRTAGELVRDLPPTAPHRPARRVVDVAPAGRRPDVEGQYERVQRVVQGDTTPAAGHPASAPVGIDMRTGTLPQQNTTSRAA
jgi:hypothetical protein